ncbi:hypothetical protein Q5705_06575 [Kosakonia sp. H02]|nr:hypothetical protein Q5705_06575 [Kosakonia sp. H02]
MKVEQSSKLQVYIKGDFVMSARFIVFGYSWPALFAITAFLEKQDHLITQIYQDEQKLLEALQSNPSLPLIVDASPHRKILLIAAIAATSRLRSAFFTARKIYLNDKVVADFYFEEKKCLTHEKLISMTKEEIDDALRVERSPACLSPGVMRPRIMNLMHHRKALYKAMQGNIYHRLYLLGATTNEINTLRLLISGLSVQKIAGLINLQNKTIYAYKAQLAQRIALSISSRELIRGLSVGEANQDNNHLKHIYETHCNKGESHCAACPFCHFCYDTECG